MSIARVLQVQNRKHAEEIDYCRPDLFLGNPDSVLEIPTVVKWPTGIRSWTGQIDAE